MLSTHSSTLPILFISLSFLFFVFSQPHLSPPFFREGRYAFLSTHPTHFIILFYLLFPSLQFVSLFLFQWEQVKATEPNDPAQSLDLLPRCYVALVSLRHLPHFFIFLLSLDIKNFSLVLYFLFIFTCLFISLLSLSTRNCFNLFSSFARFIFLCPLCFFIFLLTGYRVGPRDNCGRTRLFRHRHQLPEVSHLPKCQGAFFFLSPFLSSGFMLLLSLLFFPFFFDLRSFLFLYFNFTLSFVSDAHRYPGLAHVLIGIHFGAQLCRFGT